MTFWMILYKATQKEAKIVNIALIRCSVSGQAACQITRLGEMLNLSLLTGSRGCTLPSDC